MTISYDNFNEAYSDILRDVLYRYDYLVSPRGVEIRELLNYSFTVRSPTCEPVRTRDLERNATIAAYTQKELDVYCSGSNLVSDFARASTFWNKIANPDQTINSAYGHLLWVNAPCGDPRFTDKRLTPWQWAKQSLIADKDTRQAIIYFNLPIHAWQGNKDFPCTLTGLFNIRDDKLNLSIVMRSNDVVLGLPYDYIFWVFLLDKMLEDLRSTYPNLKKGSCTHFAHSLHLYTKDLDKAHKMLGDQFQ